MSVQKIYIITKRQTNPSTGAVEYVAQGNQFWPATEKKAASRELRRMGGGRKGDNTIKLNAKYITGTPPAPVMRDFTVQTVVRATSLEEAKAKVSVR